jgi:KaiC/GvpD/RAD55 family RecA-like ATPase
MKQIYFITGSRGIGKSTAAARFARPSEINQMVVVDCEDSMNDIVESNERMGVEFGAYIRAYEQLGNEEEREALLSNIAKGTLPWVSEKQKSSLIAFWDWLVKRLDEIITPDSNFKFLVIDPVAPVEAALAAWAESDKKRAGWRTKAYGKFEIEAVRPLLKNFLEAVYARGIETILVTSHLKNP